MVISRCGNLKDKYSFFQNDARWLAKNERLRNLQDHKPF